MRYLVSGAEFVILARREDAYQQMHERCNGSYEISREWDEAGGTVTALYGQSITNSNAWGRGSATAYSNSTLGSWDGAGTSTANAQALATSSTEIWRNIEFACLPRIDQSPLPVPAAVATGPQPLVPSEETESTKAISQIVPFLSLETGCQAAAIAHVASAGNAHRLLACGRAFVCVEGEPNPSCRPALVDELNVR